MRIWDISPGYLNRQSLLGEHRELHGLVSILVKHKKGYSKHPETLRWVGYGWAIKKRHQLIVNEMELRGYKDNTPVLTRSNKGCWPLAEIDSPFEQFNLLKNKYLEKESGRLVLPSNAQQIWSQHKYSILARDPNLYKEIGRKVSTMRPNDDFSKLSSLLCNSLKNAPCAGGIRNSLQHMWGYISKYSDFDKKKVNTAPLILLLYEIQRCSVECEEPYLKNSTALSELGAWV